jgi:hypothetical protein
MSEHAERLKGLDALIGYASAELPHQHPLSSLGPWCWPGFDGAQPI